MPSYVAINPVEHKGKSWRGPSNFLFSTDRSVLFPGLNELTRLALIVTLAFIREGERVRMVAVLGLEPNTNLYLTPEGAWALPYVPAALQAYPFALGPAPSGDLILCVDQGSGLVYDNTNAHPFFSFDGVLDPAVKKLMDLLVLYEQQRINCDLLSKQLCAAGVLMPWNITLSTPLGERVVEGLYTIDEAKFLGLESEAFLALRASGALTMAYCQMLSTHHMDGLIQKAAARAKLEATNIGAPMELDFSRLGS